MVHTKVCSKCGEEKHVLGFAEDPKAKDGLTVHCRDC